MHCDAFPPSETLSLPPRWGCLHAPQWGSRGPAPSPTEEQSPSDSLELLVGCMKCLWASKRGGEPSLLPCQQQFHTPDPCGRLYASFMQ